MIDIEKIEALAKAATPGPWVSYTPTGAALNPFEATFVAGPPPRYMDRSQGFCPADGNYIASLEPAAILALIAEVRALREDKARIDWLQQFVDKERRATINTILGAYGIMSETYTAGAFSLREAMDLGIKQKGTET